MLGLWRERYADFTVKHFHQQRAKRHDYKLGYTVAKLHLHRSGLVKPAPRRSAHRKKRPRRPMPGMLLHQDASRLSSQIPPSALRPHFVRAKVRVVDYPDGTLAVFLGPHRLADYDAGGSLIAADPPATATAPAAGEAVDLWTTLPRCPQVHRYNHNRSSQSTSCENRTT